MKTAFNIQFDVLSCGYLLFQTSLSPFSLSLREKETLNFPYLMLGLKQNVIDSDQQKGQSSMEFQC
uniref:Uncharacterized protein n=1 Tax=Rhizophora mucronata TaxID=61149 RepID=A0A2P2P080_RHIMU